MKLVNRIKRMLCLFLVNNFLAGTHFFGTKRTLLRFGGIEVGDGTKVVGPLHIGSAASLKLGNHVWLGRNATVEGNGSVVIGDRVDIGPCVSFGTGGHKIGGHEHRAGKGIVTHIVIGSGTWIGQNSVVINDSSIGEGVVIAGGALVIGNVPSDVLVAGVPAKVKRHLD